MVPVWWLIFIVPASVSFGVAVMALVMAGLERRRTAVLRRLYEDSWNQDVDEVMREMHLALQRSARNV